MMKSVLIFTACLMTVVVAREKITVTNTKRTRIDLKNSGLTTRYCETQKKQCPVPDIELARFAPTTRLCTIRCSYELECLSAFYESNKTCHLRGERCASSELEVANGSDYYRLKRGETCPTDRPLFYVNFYAYTTTFCLLKDKVCPGHNLYRSPLYRMKPLLRCLQKCSSIATCTMADFTDNKCLPKEHTCTNDELVDSIGSINALRLKAGVEECDAERTITCSDNAHVEGVTCVCDEGYEDVEGTCFRFCTANSYREGTTCVCYSGYEKVDKNCLINCGRNSYRQGASCVCNNGFEKVGGHCTVNCGRNSYRHGASCVCNNGFEKVGGHCTVNCGRNSYRHGASCVCNNGFEKVGGQCTANCGTNSYRQGTSCVCRNGFEKVGGECTAIAASKTDDACKHGDLYQYVGDCNKFYHCSHGTAHVKLCPGNTVFYPGIDVCVHSYQYKCPYSGSGGGEFCQNKADGMYQIDGDCSRFYHCSNHLTYIKDCPASTIYSPQQLRCLHSWQYNCPF